MSPSFGALAPLVLEATEPGPINSPGRGRGGRPGRARGARPSGGQLWRGQGKGRRSPECEPGSALR